MNIETPEQNIIPAGYLLDAKGRMVPERMIKDHVKMEDDMVKTVMGYASKLNEQVARFKGHTYDDIETYLSLLDEKYGKKKGGRKGNMTFTSFDGCMKVQVAMSDHYEYGPELQVAKGLIDECIADWSAELNDSIPSAVLDNFIVLVNHTFNVDKAGKVNRESLINLKRIELDDDRWRSAVEAINDSIRVVGSKAYIRIHRRATSSDEWQAVTIDLAKARRG